MKKGVKLVMKHKLCLLLVLFMLIPTTGYGIQIMPLPDLVVSKIGLDSANHIAFTVTNQSKSVMPKGWTAIAEVYANQQKLGNISLNEPTSTDNGGLDAAGGSAYFLTDLTLSKEASVTIIADATKSVLEADENNNSLTVYLTPKPEQPLPDLPDLPDLKVSGVTTAAGNRLAIIIRNIGKGSIPAGATAVAEIHINKQKVGSIDLGKPTESFFGGIVAAGGFSPT